MAKTGYPFIDYVICSERGTCVTKGPHGVRATGKALSPVVVNLKNV